MYVLYFGDDSVELGTYTGTSMALDKILDTLKPQFSE